MAQPNVPAIVFGGLFLGAWLFVAFTLGIAHPWTNWGLFGLAIAGGTYAARLVNDTYRILVWSGVGILLGLVLMFVIVQRELLGILAIILTSTGAGLIASALPPQPPTVPGAVPPYPYAHGQFDPNQPPAAPGHGYGYGGYAPQEPYAHQYDPYAHPQQQPAPAPEAYAHDPYAPQAPQQGQPPAQGGAPQPAAEDWNLHDPEADAERERRRKRSRPDDRYDPNYQ